ncbi:protein FAR1-RELATED SEQUENCE 1-like isoform X2 [Olea europaea var. sylvestris]|uniref:protein FAR1-RELATED SEQUENCE 1-like isoform X2 n=1 Tax=Olea europaea var. sylvestris TaxID=158386 RepID=UPI000C1D3590|nr:protein FAR1-RELATED SEQUENCE 1-like isoform X2 [Olea europaea var. sylvestris]
MKTFTMSFRRDTCELICSCHLFEFWGIICRHAIAVLFRNKIFSMPHRYIIKRWRRDVSRAHTRIAVNYDGLASTLGQLRYDEMCQAFSEVADLAADDEGRACSVMEWIRSQANELWITKSSIGSTGQIQMASSNAHLLDPASCKRKGAPRKFRRKSPLEASSNRSKASASLSKGKRPTVRCSNTEETSIDVQAAQLPQRSMPTPLQCFILPTPPNVALNAQGLVMPYLYPHLPD